MDKSKKVRNKRTENKVKFKNRIREYRTNKGLTIGQLAEKLGKTSVYIVTLEARGSFPRESVRAHMLTTLGCGFDDLFYEVKDDSCAM